jgi:hypothetical protein
MKGLELSEAYYREVVRPMLLERFADRTDRMAVGLVGEGSECYGYDDEISRDHDFGPGAMIWLNDADAAAFGEELQAGLDGLPRSFGGFDGRNTSLEGAGRMGVHTIRSFYQRYTGLPRPPQTGLEWLRVPETGLSTATNGRVFVDPPGEFSRYRTALQAYYPEGVRLKKLADGCEEMAQAGQYNYARCRRRGETVAACLAVNRFIEAACCVVFLLNRRYRPFYKWVHRALGELPLLGHQAQSCLSELVDPGCANPAEQIEWLCALVTAELQWQGLSHSSSDFLLNHARDLRAHLGDRLLVGVGSELN